MHRCPMFTFRLQWQVSPVMDASPQPTTNKHVSAVVSDDGTMLLESAGDRLLQFDRLSADVANDGHGKQRVANFRI